MIRTNLSEDNGPTSKHLAARGGVCVPSPGDARPTCPPQHGHGQALLPASSLPPQLWYLGIYHPAPPPPGPISAVAGGETLGVLRSSRHPHPISPGGESELFLGGFWGWSSTGHADSTISRYRDVPSLLLEVEHPTGTSLSQQGM